MERSFKEILEDAHGKGKDHIDPTDKYARAKAYMYGLGYRDRTEPESKSSSSQPTRTLNTSR